jgi:hypothetical protein
MESIVDLRFDEDMWVCLDCIENEELRKSQLVHLCGLVDKLFGEQVCNHCGGTHLLFFRGDCNDCPYGSGQCTCDEEVAEWWVE